MSPNLISLHTITSELNVVRYEYTIHMYVRHVGNPEDPTLLIICCHCKLFISHRNHNLDSNALIHTTD